MGPFSTECTDECITIEIKFGIISMLKNSFSYLEGAAKYFLYKSIETAKEITAMTCYISVEAFIDEIESTIQKDIEANRQYLKDSQHLQHLVTMIDHNVNEIRQELVHDKNLYDPYQPES